jgi:hypothetical protein
VIIHHSKVTGTSFRPLPDDLKPGELLVLAWEPDNVYGSRLPNYDYSAAVKVLRKADGAHLGYLPDLSGGSQTAQVVAAHFAKGGSTWAQLSEITGGTPSAPNRGLNIRYALLGGDMPRFGKAGTGAKVTAGVYMAVLTGFQDKTMPANQFNSEPQEGVDWLFEVNVDGETVRMGKWTSLAIGEKSNAYNYFKSLNGGKEFMRAGDTQFDWEQAIGRSCYVEVEEKANGWSNIKGLIPIVGAAPAVSSNKAAAPAPAPTAPAAAPAVPSSPGEAKPSAQDFILLKKGVEAAGKTWADLVALAQSYGKSSVPQMTYADVELACMELGIDNPLVAESKA